MRGYINLLTEYKDDINQLFNEVKKSQKEKEELEKLNNDNNKENDYIFSSSHSIVSCWEYMENISLILKINKNEYTINNEQFSILKKFIEYIRDTSKDKETPELRFY